jgi:23S rRNA (adenine2503-C2)-methyltransferase
MNMECDMAGLPEIKGMSSRDIFEHLAPLGADERAARRIQAAVCRTGVFPVSMPEVSDKFLSLAARQVKCSSLECIEKAVSDDGFMRYLFRGEGAGLFEAVRIPLTHKPGDEKYVVCVSSQAGCAMGCTFCATGALGFIRDLEVWEIVDQVLKVRSDSLHPVRGVVFMGMGEPMLNYDKVKAAAQIMTEPSGPAISSKSITISTAGVIPGIRRFTAERLPYRLVVSLSAATGVKREQLIPAERTYPLPQLVDALKEYHAVTGERITLAWTLVSGFNCAEEDAIELAELLQGLPVKIDLIDVNDPSGKLIPPSDDERNRFLDYLRLHLGMPVARRYSGGKDIAAGCGMLAGRALRT